VLGREKGKDKHTEDLTLKECSSGLVQGCPKVEIFIYEVEKNNPDLL